MHIQDVCRGIINAITHGRIGDCYLLAGENLSYREFFRLLNHIARERRIMIPIPAFILKLGGMAGSLIQRLTRSPMKLNNTSACLLCLNNYYTGKKSERELHLAYTPVEDAITGAFHWFKEKNYLQR